MNNIKSFVDKFKKKNIFDKFLFLITNMSIVVTVFILLFIIGYVLITGIPYLKPSLFELHYTRENVSFVPSLISTLIIVVISLSISVPLGVGTAIFLVEYASSKNKFIEIIRLTTETLSGIPSIVYGLFGMLFFVQFLDFGFSIISGSLTLSIMVLPLIMRTTEEALKSVPNSLREASFGLGAGKLRTIFVVVLPSAIQGILAGIILSTGRIIGESAALIFTAGTVTQIPTGLGLTKDTSFLFNSASTLSVHMYNLSGEGFHMNEAKATAVVLLGLVLLINLLSSFISKKIVKG